MYETVSTKFAIPDNGCTGERNVILSRFVKGLPITKTLLLKKKHVYENILLIHLSNLTLCICYKFSVRSNLQLMGIIHVVRNQLQCTLLSCIFVEI